MATLLSIDTDKPIIVRELGTGGKGIVWTVEPENFQRVIEMINTHGGPNAWRIELVEA